jgi:hypothetical protein
MYCSFGGLLTSSRCNGTGNFRAVAVGEHSAALVSIQRHQPGQPLHKNVNSADCTLTPACHFSGFYAKSATLLHFVHFTCDFLTITPEPIPTPNRAKR